MAEITLTGVCKNFGAHTVIPALDLRISDKEFVVLVGPSGCGKTTALRMIAGLESTSGGAIHIGAKDVTELRPGLRNCAMVFQNYALYPHMSVAENIGYGMKVRGTATAEITRSVNEAASVVGLRDLLHRRPKELSGGQRQRVAIARALVRRPDVFLFDEPLSNLDAKLRIEMRSEVKRLHQRLQTTIVYVTHDQVEAMTLADRVVVMNKGHVEQAADPLTLYNTPRNLFVAGFIGAPTMNFLPVRCALTAGGTELSLSPQHRIKLDKTTLQIWGQLPKGELVLGIRPEHLALDPEGPITMAVETVETLGSHILLVGSVAGQPFSAQVSSDLAMKPESTVQLSPMSGKIHLFDAATGLSLRAA